MDALEKAQCRYYLYGYYCGLIGLTVDNPTRSWLLGETDAKGDVENNAQALSPIPVVSTHAKHWGDLNQEGLVIGSFHPRQGLCLYYQTTEDDGFSGVIYSWDARPYPSSGRPRGWKIINTSAIIDS